MSTMKPISLKNLWINTENYRFEPNESQAEAIAVMVEDQKDKLLTLAEDIAASGMNPSDIPMITDLPSHKGKFLVLEGNRRVTAMKILDNPSLLNDTTASPSLKKKFNDLHKTSKHKLPEKVYCVFYEDPTEADKWIRLKHTGENDGLGTVPWDGQQKARYQVRVGEQSSPGLQVLEYLKNTTSFDDSLKSKLPKVAITTLTRLVTDKDVQTVLGVAIENGQVVSKLPESEVLKGYTQVIKDLLRKDFNVKSVYTKEQREEYAKNFPASAKPNLALAINPLWPVLPSVKGQPATANSSTPKPKKAVTDRNKIIPKNCIIKISNPKVNDIYDELQRMSLSEFIFGPAALLRVFIELSFDVYVEEYTLATTPSSAKSGTALHAKGHQVVNHMKSKGWSDDAVSLGMRNLLNGKDSILSLETLHAYLHNHRVSPTDDTLKRAWDGIQDFIIILWNNIK